MKIALVRGSPRGRDPGLDRPRGNGRVA
jgi:hypothetical protein